jgi:thiol-disulfide isomerase/thioredoxin
MKFNTLLFCVLFNLPNVNSQSAEIILKKVRGVNEKSFSGHYTYVSYFKFGQTMDTTTMQNSEVAFSTKAESTICRIMDKTQQQILIYDTGAYKKIVSLVDSNLYLKLRNTPEADNVLFDYTRPYYFLSLSYDFGNWSLESQTDTSYVLITRFNPDSAIVYRRWARLFIDTRIFVPFKFQQQMEIIEEGVDTLIQFEEQRISNYKFNLSEEEIGAITKLDSSIFAHKKIVHLSGFKEAIVDTLKINATIDHLSLKSIDNMNVHFAELNYKILIIDFYYSACYPCMLSLPVLAKINERYKSKGVTLVGINPEDKDFIKLKRLLNAKDIQYINCSDELNEVTNAFGVTAYPTLLLFDSERKFFKKIVGYSADLENELTQIVEEAIN